jgi:sortase (surface protein transpeptidase)
MPLIINIFNNQTTSHDFSYIYKYTKPWKLINQKKKNPNQIEAKTEKKKKRGLKDQPGY